MYKVLACRAYIDGQKGIYDKEIANPAVRYGRNAANNNFEYLKTVQNKSKGTDKKNSNDKWRDNLAPLEFEYRYAPKEKVSGHGIDKMALMGTAYEELGQKTSISTEELTEQLQNSYGEGATAEILDLNNDSTVDLAEYSTLILLTDMYSSGKKFPNKKDIDGVITDKGKQTVTQLTDKYDCGIIRKTHQEIYKSYGLEYAQENFVNNTNNLIKIA